MELIRDADQADLADLLDQVLIRESTSAHVRAAEPAGFDPELWSTLSRLGVFDAVADAESQRRLGLAVVIGERCGRYLASVPFVDAVCLRVLAAVAPSEQLRGDLDNGAVGAVAFVSGSDRPEHLVAAGAVADFLVLASTSTLTRHRASESKVRPLRATHGSIPAAIWTVESDGFPYPDLGAAHSQSLITTWKLVSAAAMGAAGLRAVELATDYAKERQAFGGPIGRFQGVAHPLAVCWTELTGTELLTAKAAWAVDTGQPDAARLVDLAYANAAEAAQRATAAAVHVHGGYGAALEYDVQLYHRRARSWSQPLGDPAALFEAVGRRLVAEMN
jgi:3-oxochol-4-en-24-oyl-CoA dehydrogenase